jgi:hypothetical protein
MRARKQDRAAPTYDLQRITQKPSHRRDELFNRLLDFEDETGYQLRIKQVNRFEFLTKQRLVNIKRVGT